MQIQMQENNHGGSGSSSGSLGHETLYEAVNHFNGREVQALLAANFNEYVKVAETYTEGVFKRGGVRQGGDDDVDGGFTTVSSGNHNNGNTGTNGRGRDLLGELSKSMDHLSRGSGSGYRGRGHNNNNNNNNNTNTTINNNNNNNNNNSNSANNTNNNRYR